VTNPEADRHLPEGDLMPADAARPAYAAVVFDLDGTLVDSVELITISFQHAI